MFVDSLHYLHTKSSDCLLASSALEVCVDAKYFLVNLPVKRKGFYVLSFPIPPETALLLSSPGHPCERLGISQCKEDDLH